MSTNLPWVIYTYSILRPCGDCPDRLWVECSLISGDKVLHWFQKESCTGYYWEWLLHSWFNLNRKENKGMSLSFADNNVLRVTILHNPEPNSEPGGFFFRGGGGGRGLLPVLKEKVLLSYTCYWPKWYLFYRDINNKTEKRKATYPV